MSTQLVKLTIFISRKEGMTENEFHKYWSETHAKVFLSIPIAKKNVVKYTQYHANSQQMATLSSALNVVKWDGVVVIYARSFEDVVAIFSDPDYRNVVVPDEQNFVDKNSVQAMIGYEEVKYESVV